MTVHSNPGTGSSGPCTPQKDQTPSHVCSGGGLTQGRETESFLGSHLSPGPLLGSKQQKEEKRTVTKVRKFKVKHVKGVYSSATRITQEEEEILSLNCLLPPPNARHQATCATSFYSHQQVDEGIGSRPHCCYLLANNDLLSISHVSGTLSVQGQGRQQISVATN